jgi:hypothetical protein
VIDFLSSLGGLHTQGVASGHTGHAHNKWEEAVASLYDNYPMRNDDEPPTTSPRCISLNGRPRPVSYRVPTPEGRGRWGGGYGDSRPSRHGKIPPGPLATTGARG